MTPYATAALDISPERVRNARLLLAVPVGVCWPLVVSLVLSGRFSHNNDPEMWSVDCMTEMIRSVGNADKSIQSFRAVFSLKE